jgi:hypothetical protein
MTEVKQTLIERTNLVTAVDDPKRPSAVLRFCGAPHSVGASESVSRQKHARTSFLDFVILKKGGLCEPEISGRECKHRCTALAAWDVIGGRLVASFRHGKCRFPTSYWIVCSKATPKIVAFSAWLLAEVAQDARLRRLKSKPRASG